MPLLNSERLARYVQESRSYPKQLKFVRKDENIVVEDSRFPHTVLLDDLKDLLGVRTREEVYPIQDAGFLLISSGSEFTASFLGDSESLRIVIDEDERKKTGEIAQSIADELKTDEFALAVRANI